MIKAKGQIGKICSDPVRTNRTESKRRMQKSPGKPRCNVYKEEDKPCGWGKKRRDREGHAVLLRPRVDGGLIPRKCLLPFALISGAQNFD